MTKPKVLFLGGGRRVSLAKLFRAAGCQVLGYELNTQVPLATVGTVVQGGPWEDTKRLAADLSRLCDEEGVQLVLPLDCAAVAAVASCFRHPAVATSLLQTAAICLNKQQFAFHCLVHAPHLYPEAIKGERAILKPIFGYGSRDIRSVTTFRGTPQGYVAQKELDGREYSVDAYYDQRGRLVGASPRERLRVAGGEVVDSITVNRPDLLAAVGLLSSALEFRGPVCFQFMEATAENNRIYVTECNARFGGGATLSIEAGLDMVSYLLHEYVYRKPLPGDVFSQDRWQAGLLLKRSFRDAFFHEKAGI